MNFLLKKLHLTCRDIGPLISREMDDPLKSGQCIRVQIHLALCKVCRFYKDHLLTLRCVAKALAKEEAQGNEEIVLNPDARKKIKKTLDANL